MTSFALNAEDLAQAKAKLPRLFAIPFAVSAARSVIAAAVVLYLAVAIASMGLTWDRFLGGFARLGDIVRLMFPPTDAGLFLEFAGAMGETLGMAFLGTLIAALIAAPLGFLGARNVMPNPMLHFLIRRFFDVFRATPSLIWALVFIGAVGLGPMAGVLALILSDFAALAKLNAEAIENADRRPVEGVRASGASRLLILRFGLLPQILPVMLSQALYFFESNVRSATVFGIVGAGGIGFYLTERIKLNIWDQAAFILIMFLAVVWVIDQLSHWARRRLMGER